MRQQLRPFIHLLINSSFANWWNQKTCANILLLLSSWFCHSKLHKFSRILVFFSVNWWWCHGSLRRKRFRVVTKNESKRLHEKWGEFKSFLGLSLLRNHTETLATQTNILWRRHRNFVFDVFFFYIIFILKYSVKYQLLAIHYRPCRGWGCWYNNASLLFIWGYSEHSF